MIYMGSKRRIAKHILPIILRNRSEDQWYIEPFVGGGNMIENVSGKRAGYDIDKYVIAALKLIRDNPSALPKNRQEVGEDEYLVLKAIGKNNTGKGTVSDAMLGYVGYHLSYGGRWFTTYRRDRKTGRDYTATGYRHALRQSDKIKGAIFETSDYKSIQIPANSIIYCDPPYADTQRYKNKFDLDRVCFWQWCREKQMEGHKVFVSEYKAPADFVSIWEKEICCTLLQDKKATKVTEKLFIHETQELE